MRSDTMRAIERRCRRHKSRQSFVRTEPFYWTRETNALLLYRHSADAPSGQVSFCSGLNTGAAHAHDGLLPLPVPSVRDGRGGLFRRPQNGYRAVLS